jgi:hypothetical protein
LLQRRRYELNRLSEDRVLLMTQLLGEDFWTVGFKGLGRLGWGRRFLELKAFVDEFGFDNLRQNLKP